MEIIGWNITNGYGEPTNNYSKNHIVNENTSKTLCGKDIPAHADHDGGYGYCKRCEKKAS